MAARSTISSKGRMDFGPNVTRLLKMRVLVGIPDTAAEREPEPGQKEPPPSNALIGYMMEYGDDEKHIPARPFLLPGVRSALPEITEQFRRAGEDAFDEDFSKVERRFERIGSTAASAVKQKIFDGPFTPLSERTIEARAERGRKGAKQYLKLLGQGTPKHILDNLGDQALLRPLIDTGQLRRSVTYVVKAGSS